MIRLVFSVIVPIKFQFQVRITLNGSKSAGIRYFPQNSVLFIVSSYSYMSFRYNNLVQNCDVAENCEHLCKIES